MLPNVIVLTSGRSGSTLLVNMLLRFGWQANDIDPEWGEPREFVRKHQEHILGHRLAEELRQDIQDYLSKAVCPWVIKGPCIGRCWSLWSPILSARDDVFVILSERDREAVAESHRKRGWSVEDGMDSRDAAERALEAWQGPKLRIPHERLCSAAVLVDPSRVS